MAKFIEGFLLGLGFGLGWILIHGLVELVKAVL